MISLLALALGLYLGYGYHMSEQVNGGIFPRLLVTFLWLPISLFSIAG